MCARHSNSFSSRFFTHSTLTSPAKAFHYPDLRLNCKFTDRVRKTSELWIIEKYLYALIEKWFRVCECGIYCCRRRLSVNETRYLTKCKGARPRWGAGRVSPLLTFQLFVFFLTNLFRYYLFKSLCVFFQHIVISLGHQWKESKMNVWEIQHEKNMKFIIFFFFSLARL